jgi:hypothetical protein
LWSNEEAPFPQPSGTVFKRVLRKKHADKTVLELSTEIARQFLIYILYQLLSSGDRIHF